MKSLLIRFKRLKFFGYKYTALTTFVSLVALLWCGICLFYFDRTSDASAPVGESLTWVCVYGVLGHLLNSYCNTWVKGFAHYWLRKSLQTVLGALILLCFVCAIRAFLPIVTKYGPILEFIGTLSALKLLALIWVGPIVLVELVPRLYRYRVGLDEYRFFRKRKKGFGGSSRWAGPGTYKGKYLRPLAGYGERTDAIVLGETRYLDTGYVKTVAFKDASHILCLATSGAGKNTTFLANNSQTVDNEIVNDPKGELALQSYWFNAQQSGNYKGRCYMLDPFEVNKDRGIPFSKYGLFSEIDPDDPQAPFLINTIAEACVFEENTTKEKHFVEIPRQFLAALIAHVLTSYPKENRNIGFVCDLVYGIDQELRVARPEGFQELLIDMLTNSHDLLGDIIVRGARDLQKVGDKERGSHLSSLSRGLAWVADKRMRDHVCGESDFKFADIGVDGFSTHVYIVYPFGYESYKRWMRCLLNLSIALMRRRVTKPKFHTRLVIDEAAVLGPMEALKEGIVTLRQEKIKLIICVQNLAQLKHNFGEEWSTFIANSSKFVFGLNDIDTADWLSKTLGYRTVGGRTFPLVSPSEAMQDFSKDTNRGIFLPASATKGRENMPMLLSRISFTFLNNDFKHFPGAHKRFNKAILPPSPWARLFFLFSLASGSNLGQASDPV